MCSQHVLFADCTPSDRVRSCTQTGMLLTSGGYFAQLADKIEHVMKGEHPVKSPKALHPAFYGCYDWHSSVHGHWLLARLLRLYPDLPEAQEVRRALGANLTEENVRAEVEYFRAPGRQSFERTYGWAWLLKLAEELRGWDDPDARQWSRNLRPLADVIVARYRDFLP